MIVIAGEWRSLPIGGGLHLERFAAMAPKPKGWEEYRERNRLLKAMGFDTYRDYLDSDLWRRIRSVIMANQPECGLC